MKATGQVMQEGAEDIFFGQVVINWARWFLIAGGIFLVLLTGANEAKLVMGIVPLLSLMALNFFLHGRQLAERPANPALITLASVADLAVITGVILLWSEDAGLGSQFFIMYYPVVLAFAFVMPRGLTSMYTFMALMALAAYAGACVLVDVHSSTDLASMSLADAGPLKVLITRLVTLGAMGGLGTYFWRVQRVRRRRALGLAPQAAGDSVGC